jgi:hypothetical protein
MVMRSLIVSLVALAASAGCATGTGSVAVESNGSSALEGQASPGLGSDVQDCRGGGVYNRATGLCVSEGGN